MPLNAAARWLVIASFVALDAVGMPLAGMRLVVAELLRVALALAALSALGAFYFYLRPRERIVDLAHSAVQLLIFFAAGAVLTYVAAATQAPLVDGALAAADRALGFDWLQWFNWVHSRPVLAIALHAAYDAAGPAIIVLPLYFALSGQPERNSEFLWLLIVSVVLIIPLSGLMPGAGAFVFYDVADQAYAPFVPEFAAIRRGEIHDLALTHLQGIVTFPSFHTTLALLFPYVLRKSRVLCAVASLVSTAMLVAIPSEGGHYLVDVIAGALVALAAIWATARIEARLRRRAALAMVAEESAPRA